MAHIHAIIRLSIHYTFNIASGLDYEFMMDISYSYRSFYNNMPHTLQTLEISTLLAFHSKLSNSSQQESKFYL